MASKTGDQEGRHVHGQRSGQSRRPRSCNWCAPLRSTTRAAIMKRRWRGCAERGKLRMATPPDSVPVGVPAGFGESLPVEAAKNVRAYQRAIRNGRADTLAEIDGQG